VNKVAIITDTVSQMPRELADEYNVKLASMHVILNGKSYPETEIDLAWFYQQVPKWKEADRMPTTSTVSVNDFLEAFRELGQKAEAILCITYSSKFGMVHNTATQAKKMAEEELPQIAVEIIDSYTVCGAQMLIVLEAARAAAVGKSLPEVVALVNNLVEKVNCVAILDDLSFLAKGGRIHKARSWVGSQITNTMLLEASISTGGEMKPLARGRTRRQALERLFEIVEQRNGNGKLHVAIEHIDASAEAEQLKELAMSRFPCAEVFVNPIYPLVTIHTGIGAIHFSWWCED